MSVKEITVFMVGLVLIGFLYLMRHPQQNNAIDINSSTDENLQIIQAPIQEPDFTPKSEVPILDRILDVPEWTFDISKIGVLTADEITKSIELAIEEKRFFEEVRAFCGSL